MEVVDWWTQLLDEQDVMVARQVGPTVSSCVADGGLGGITTPDRQLYGNMSRALNATGRPITFSLCQWGEQHVEWWGAEVAQMYRVQMDHLPLWVGPGSGAGAGIGQGTLQIIEYMAGLSPSTWTRRFGWLDPDL